MTLYQKSVAEISAQPVLPENDIQSYVPTDDDRSRGKYAALTERKLEDGSPDWDSTVHMIPVFDRKPHLVHSACWCGVIEMRDPDYYEHRSSQ